MAARRRHPHLIRLLLNHGALINGEDAEKRTALHCACYAGWMECVQVLVEEGANVNARSELSITPLMESVIHNDKPEILEYLISHGADPNAADVAGYTALHKCAAINHAANARVLLTRGAYVDPREKKVSLCMCSC